MNVSVVGLGKLGLPLACLHAQHNRVFGIDVNQSTVHAIGRGENPVRETGLSKLLFEVRQDGSFTAHTDFYSIANSEVTIVIVPTPSIHDGSFSNKYILDAIVNIGRNLRKQQGYHLVVICSTVMPGTCDGDIRYTLEAASERLVGGDLGLVYSPEFIALGSVIEDMKHPDMILIGENDGRAGAMFEHLIRCIVGHEVPAFHMTLTNAELSKIAVNSFVTMKISFANTIGEICQHMHHADAHVVTDAIGTDRRIGKAYLRPGVAFGGPCFPRDSKAFQALARRYDVPAPLSEATDDVNDRQVARALEVILSTGRSRVGIIGLAYKPGTHIHEESFGVELAQVAASLGLQVRVFDPKVNADDVGSDFPYVEWQNSVRACADNDMVSVICTPDDAFRSEFPQIFEDVSRQRALVIDPWGIIPGGPWDETNVIRLSKGP